MNLLQLHSRRRHVVPSVPRACASRTVCATRCTRLPPPHLDTGLLSIYTGLGQETERKALDLILRELDEFCQNGPEPDELSRCREQAKTTLLMGLENTGKPHDDHRPQ